MDLDSKEVSRRIKDFIDCRTVKIAGREYLPVNDKTIHDLTIELSIPQEAYHNIDDFRSRA